MITIHGKEVRQSLEEVLDPRRTAVIAIDIQNDFFADSGVFAAAGRDMSLARERLPNMIRLMRRAQESGLFTVFIRQVTLPRRGRRQPGLAASQGPRREEPGLHPCRILGGGFLRGNRAART